MMDTRTKEEGAGCSRWGSDEDLQSEKAKEMEEDRKRKGRRSKSSRRKPGYGRNLVPRNGSGGEEEKELKEFYYLGGGWYTQKKLP